MAIKTGEYNLGKMFGSILPPFDSIVLEDEGDSAHLIWLWRDESDKKTIRQGLIINQFFTADRGKFFVLRNEFAVTIDENGMFVNLYYRNIDTSTATQWKEVNSVIEGDSGSQMRGIVTTLNFLSFLNCRRQTQIVERPDLNPPDKWLRRQKQPKLRYHTLNIDPLKKMLKYDAVSDPTGKELAWHLCRGHWKHYTAEKPLFGHYVGSVWCPPHAKGKTENGVVLKEYTIKTDGPVPESQG